MQIHYDERFEIRRPRSLWRDTLVGMAAGVVGTAVMNQFWKVLEAASSDEDDGGSEDAEATGQLEEEGLLDDVALVGPYHREEESAPETAARVVYEKLQGEEPDDETRAALANRAHWAMGMALGAAYGLLRGSRGSGLDVGGGLAFGAGAWLAADEIMVPILGLSEGPTAHPPEAHVQGLGAHLVYGVATAAAARVLDGMT